MKQWQERSEQLESNSNDFEQAIMELNTNGEETVHLWQERTLTLESQMKSQEKEAAHVITEWENQVLEQQLVAKENDNTVAELRAEVTTLATDLKSNKAESEKTQDHFKKTQDLSAQCSSEWHKK